MVLGGFKETGREICIGRYSNIATLISCSIGSWDGISWVGLLMLQETVRSGAVSSTYTRPKDWSIIVYTKLIVLIWALLLVILMLSMLIILLVLLVYLEDLLMT